MAIAVWSGRFSYESSNSILCTIERRRPNLGTLLTAPVAMPNPSVSSPKEDTIVFVCPVQGCFAVNQRERDLKLTHVKKVHHLDPATFQYETKRKSDVEKEKILFATSLVESRSDSSRRRKDLSCAWCEASLLKEKHNIEGDLVCEPCRWHWRLHHVKRTPSMQRRLEANQALKSSRTAKSSHTTNLPQTVDSPQSTVRSKPSKKRPLSAGDSVVTEVVKKRKKVVN